MAAIANPTSASLYFGDNFSNALVSPTEPRRTKEMTVKIEARPNVIAAITVR